LFLKQKVGRFCKNQKWGSREENLQKSKGIFNFNFPGKRLILFYQMNKRGHHCGIMCNESPIEVGKLKETLNISNTSWGSLVHNGLNLVRVHVNAISRNSITQEFNLRLMESTPF
jgi:hypothetical protein